MFHGGNSRRGPTHPNLRHGHYSRDGLAQLMVLAEQAAEQREARKDWAAAIIRTERVEHEAAEGRRTAAREIIDEEMAVLLSTLEAALTADQATPDQTQVAFLAQQAAGRPITTEAPGVLDVAVAQVTDYVSSDD